MKKDDLNTSLSTLAFEFFYWFSRFEFALKENGYLKNHAVGSKAEPGWNEFVKKWHRSYDVSAEAQRLLDANPEQQVVEANDALAWRAVDLATCTSKLARVVRLLQTVRNNLFHGGKHGGSGWDSPERTELLLSSGIEVLNQFSSVANIEADYRRIY